MTSPIVTTGLLVGLIAWLGVALLIGFLVGRRSDRTWFGVLTAAVAFVLPIWDLPFGLRMYKRYVEELGGTRIFRTVEAEGYLDSEGTTLDFAVGVLNGARINSEERAFFPYAYYEAWFGRGSSSDFLKEAGYYEIRLADRGSPTCAPFESWPRARDYREHRHLQDRCVVAIRRDKPRSRYAMERYLQRALPGPGWLPPVWASGHEIVDRENGEVLARTYQLVYESWFPMPRIDDARPLSWVTYQSGPLLTRDVIRLPQVPYE